MIHLLESIDMPLTSLLTRPPVLKWYKTTNFEKGTKSPILKDKQNHRFLIKKMGSFVNFYKNEKSSRRKHSGIIFHKKQINFQYTNEILLPPQKEELEKIECSKTFIFIGVKAFYRRSNIPSAKLGSFVDKTRKKSIEPFYR